MKKTSIPAAIKEQQAFSRYAPCMAIYFIMGQLKKEDGVADNLVGNDCPFEDSPVLEAATWEDLERMVVAEYHGHAYPERIARRYEHDLRGLYPDVICDIAGNMNIELCKRIIDPMFDPEKRLYSWGRENLAALWRRENFRWIKS